MKIKKVVTTGIIGAGLGLIAFAFILLILLITRPEWFLTENRIQVVLRYLIPKDLKFPIEELRFSIRSETISNKTIKIYSGPVCLIQEKSQAKICVERLNSELQLSIAKFPFVFRKLETFEVDGLSVDLQITSAPTETVNNEPNYLEIFENSFTAVQKIRKQFPPMALAELMQDRINIRLKRFTAYAGPNEISADGDFGCKPGLLANANCQLSLNGRVLKGSESLAYGTLAASVNRLESANLQSKIELTSPSLTGVLNADIKLGPNQWTIKLAANETNLEDGVPDINIEQCLVTIKARSSIQIDSDCTVSVADKENSWKLQVSNRLEALSEAKDKLLAKTRLKLLNTQNKVSSKSWVEFVSTGRPEEIFQIENQKISCLIEVVNLRFQDLRSFLETVDITVPAPFHILEGPSSFSGRCEPGSSGNHLTIGYDSSLKLKSPNQSVSLASEGTIVLEATQKIRIDARVDIDEGKLVFPKLKATALPAFLIRSDVKRLKTPDGKRDIELDYRIKLNVLRSPILAKTNLFNSPLPVTGEMLFTSSSYPEGIISIRDATLELFRRSAIVEKFDFEFSENKENPRIDGTIRVKSGHYNIYAFLSGSTVDPVVTLSSKPELSNSEIISTLLYGAPSETLSFEENQKIESVQTVILSRSVNLASLYLFATTPIQKIDIDPDEREILTSIEASDTISFQVGAAPTESGLSEYFGVKKSLGKSWQLITQWESTSKSAIEQHDGGLSIWLAWSKRY